MSGARGTTKMAPLRIALAQQPHTADIASVIGDARRGNAEIVLFPEMFSNGYVGFDPNDPDAEDRWRNRAVSLDGTYVDVFRRAAHDHRIHVVATLLEAAQPDPFNTAVLIGPEGETVLVHRKVHTCFFENPENCCAAGTTFEAADIRTRAGRTTIGLMICMDREYPEAARSLSQAGAEVILVPNACFLSEDPLVGDVRIAQMRGRSFENTTAIAVANYPAPRFDGHSFAVGPLGELVALVGSEPQLAFLDLDLDHVRATRKSEWFRWQDSREEQPVAAQ